MLNSICGWRIENNNRRAARAGTNVSIYLSIYIYIHPYLSINLSIYIYIYLSIYLPIYISIYLLDISVAERGAREQASRWAPSILHPNTRKVDLSHTL